MADLSVMGFLNEETQQETEYNLKDAQARSDISTINGKIPSAASSINKLVDTTAMNDAIGQAVSAAYKPAGNKTVAELTSSLLVAANRGKVYNMTDAGTTTADFVEGAGHPIRVGDDVGICEPTTGTFKFNILSGFIAVDTNPTQSSANPVSSGGVYSEFAGIKDGQSIDSFADVETALTGKVDKVPGKGLSTNDYNNTAKGIVDNIQNNVIANTKLIKDTVGWSGKNKLKNTATTNTINGITFTVNADGSIKANGTATGRAYINIATSSDGNNGLPQGEYIMPNIPTQFAGVNLLYLDGSTELSIKTLTTANNKFSITSETANKPLRVEAVIVSGTTVNNIMLYPMFCDANILDDTYEPYHSNVVNTLREAEVIQGKNLLENTATTITKNGITFTVNSDRTITANGTANANITDFYINTGFSLKAGKYKCNGNPTGTTGFVTGLRISDPTYTTINYFFENELDLTINEDISNLRVDIRIGSGATFNNVVFKPMIRLATETDPTYEPYYIPLKDSMFPRSEQASLGAKNLLESNAKSETQGNIPFTVNSDGTITGNGTSNSNDMAYFVMGTGWGASGKLLSETSLKVGGKYILSKGFVKEGVALFVRFYQGSTDLGGVTTTTADNQVFTIPNNTDRIIAVIRVNNGVSISPSDVFKPMIRLATDPDDTYVPYAMTNRELTEKAVTMPNTDSTTGISYYKYGNVVTVCFDASNSVTTSEAYESILKLPSGYRPPVQVSFKDSYSSKRIVIATSGDIQCGEVLSNVTIRGQITFITT